MRGCEPSPCSSCSVVIACSAPDWGTISPSRSAIAAHCAATASGVGSASFDAAGQGDVGGLDDARAGAEDRAGRRVLADQEERRGRDQLGPEQAEQFGREDVLGHPRRRGRRDRVDLDVVARALERQRPARSRRGPAWRRRNWPGRNCRRGRSSSPSSGSGHRPAPASSPRPPWCRLAEPIRWTSTTARKSSRLILAKLLSRRMPALLIRMWTPPQAAFAFVDHRLHLRRHR